MFAGVGAVGRIGRPGLSGNNAKRPSLILGFMQPGILDSRITFTRASTATYEDVSGVNRTAAINAPRWDYANGVLRGLLMEEARTNVCLQSANLSDLAWVAAGAVVIAPTVTGNQGTAPDGTLTASKIVYPQVVGAGAVSYVRQNITVPAQSHVFSMWLRGDVGGEQIYLGANTAGPINVNSSRLTLTTTWRRYSFTLTPTAASWQFSVGTDLRDVTETTTPAQTIYAWGAQVEPGAFATSYIPTTGVSATRAIDIATMPLGSWYNASTGTFTSEHIYQGFPTLLTRTLEVSDGTANNFAYMAADVGSVRSIVQTTIATVASADIPIAGAPVANVISKSTMAYGANRTFCVNNGAGPLAINTGAGGFPPLVSLMHLANTASGIRPQSLWFRNVAYWPRQLTNTEITAVTT